MGIIGAGLAFERLHYPAYLELKDRYQVVAVCDREEKKARFWVEKLGLGEEAAYTDYREMLQRPDLDAVDIMVPIPANFTVVEDVIGAWAGRSGKAVLCEKPLAPDYEQAEAFLALAERSGIPIMVAENYRFEEEIDGLRRLVVEEKVGRTVYFLQNRVACFPCAMTKDDFARTEWRQHPAYPGGTLLDVGVHDLAALRYIFGPIERLHAFGRRQGDDFSPYAAVSVNLRFRSGVIGQFSFYDAGREPHRPLVGLRIFGTAGEIYLEERDAGIIHVDHNDDRHEEIRYTPRRGYYHELVEFHRALMEKRPFTVTPATAFGDVKAVFAILRSIERGEAVPVEEAKSPAKVGAGS
ncbi:MAG: Gfo/Idh/MocA family oxidoreductase [Firmicutes bacterium]|nr:Gfo/Idh/MocA family oxidoreductase [Bacillota bacterium]